MTSDSSDYHSIVEPDRTRLDSYGLEQLWLEFSRRFPNEESCLDAIYRQLSEGQDLECRYCSASLVFVPGRRMSICVGCSKRNWLTAGTFFERARKLRPWIAAVWLLENGLVLSSVCFAQLTKISQSSALNILRKIGIFLESRSRLNEYLTFPSHCFNETIFRRSLETPRRAHPREESSLFSDSAAIGDDGLYSLDDVERIGGLDIDEQKSAADISAETNSLVELHENMPHEEDKSSVLFSENSGDLRSVSQALESLTDLEREVLLQISHEPVFVEELCQALPTASADLFSSLTILELHGLIRRCPGDSYVRVKADVRLSTSISLGDQSSLNTAIGFLRKVFQGVSRKYLQIYLSVFDALGYRGVWNEKGILDLLLRVDAVKYTQVLAYVSPIEVRLASPTAY